MARATPPFLAALAMLPAVSCGPRSRTEVMVVVDAEPDVKAAATHLGLHVLAAPHGRDEWASVREEIQPVDAWPVTLGLVPDGEDASRRFDVRVSALTGPDGPVVVRKRVLSGYVAGQTRELRILLEKDCLNIQCAEDQTCHGGDCTEPDEIDPSELPRYDPSATILDAGAASRDADVDAGPPDGGVDAAVSGPDAAPPSQTVQLAAGGGHICTLLDDGSARCWGNNGFGQLGDGTTDYSPTPVVVQGLADVRVSQLTAGAAHTCALIDDGSARCWGSNDFGQLGDGTVSSRTTPVVVQGLADVRVSQLTASARHTCALIDDGSARCWGSNNVGQLGDGTDDMRRTPVGVQGLAGVHVSQLVAGIWHTCALIDDGSVRCWGANSSGQFGDGTTTSSLTPVASPGLTGATQLAAGAYRTCAVFADGSARCSGDNSWGGLGDGTGNDSTTPVVVTGLSDATAIAVGEEFTCALVDGGSVLCWGHLETGPNDEDDFLSTTPDSIGIDGATAVSAGSWFVCALVGGGSVQCVGFWAWWE